MDKLGFVAHPDKSQLLPKQEIVFLCFHLNSENKTVKLTNEKALKLLQACRDLLTRKLLRYGRLPEYFKGELLVVKNVISSFSNISCNKIGATLYTDTSKTGRGLFWKTGKHCQAGMKVKQSNISTI